MSQKKISSGVVREVTIVNSKMVKPDIATAD